MNSVWGILSSVGLEQQPSKLWVAGSIPAECNAQLHLCTLVSIRKANVELKINVPSVSSPRQVLPPGLLLGQSKAKALLFSSTSSR